MNKFIIFCLLVMLPLLAGLAGCSSKQLPKVRMADKVELDMLILQTDCSLMSQEELTAASAEVRDTCSAFVPKE